MRKVLSRMDTSHQNRKKTNHLPKKKKPIQEQTTQKKEERRENMNPSKTTTIEVKLKFSAEGTPSDKKPTIPHTLKASTRSDLLDNATIYHSDCLSWLKKQPANSIQAIVTDPPFGMREYTSEEVKKMRNGKGGVWRIPHAIGGSQRMPLPRFTVLTDDDLERMYSFIY